MAVTVNFIVTICKVLLCTMHHTDPDSMVVSHNILYCVVFKTVVTTKFTIIAWSSMFLEKLTVTQLVKLPAFYGT
jgi:hypothetical protein